MGKSKPSFNYVYLVLISLWFASCVNETTSSQIAEETSVYVLNCELPLYLGRVNLEDTQNIEKLSGPIASRIRLEIEQFGGQFEFLDSTQKAESLLLKTLKLDNKEFSVFLMLFKYYTTDRLYSRAVFYQKETGRIIEDTFDFKIFALYNLEGFELVPTNLKTKLQIDSPELELYDLNEDGQMDIRFTRLYHNGTYNALQTTVLSINNNRIDTLATDHKPFKTEYN